MGWFIRRSISLGPVKVNLSRRGVGVSAGIRGARIGVDAKGDAYAAGGRGGFYFRQRLGRNIHSGVNPRWMWLIVAIVVAIALLKAFSK